MSTWVSLRLFLNRRQTLYLLGNLATGADQIQDQPLINIEGAFVFAPITHIVALRQDSPDLRTKTKRVRQHLKDDVPLGWPESMAPECRQAESVSGAVGEIEPAVQRVRHVLRVLEPCQGRTDETRKLLRIGRFLCEDVSRTREALKRRRGGHLPIQSPKVSAAPAPASRTRFPSGRALRTRRPCTPSG